MADVTNRRAGWTTLSIVLHWLIVLLIIGQLINHEWMVDMWRAVRHGTEVDVETAVFGWTHVWLGGLVLLAAAVRIGDRYFRGRPAYPAGEPNWATWLAKITHFLIYAILILMPVAGAAAWFGGIGGAARFHTLMWTPLLVLIGLHVAGALTQQFWFKTDVLKRIVKPA